MVGGLGVALRLAELVALSESLAVRRPGRVTLLRGLGAGRLRTRLPAPLREFIRPPL